MKFSFIFLCLLIPHLAFAQFGFFDRLIGKKANLEVPWECDGTSAKYKIKVSGSSKVTLDFEPDLYGERSRKLKAGQAGDACWKAFTSAATLAATKWKDENCSEDKYAKMQFCKSGVDVFSAEVDKGITEARSKYRRDAERPVASTSSSSTNVPPTESLSHYVRVPSQEEERQADVKLKSLLKSSSGVCESLTNANIGTISLLNFHQVVANNMEGFKNMTDRSCQRAIASIYAGISHNLLPYYHPELDRICRQSPEKKMCQQWQKMLNTMISNLRQLTAIKSPDAETWLSSFGNCTDERPNTLDELLDIRDKLQQSLQCSPIAPGGERLGEGKHGGGGENYLLRRLDSKNYEAVLALNFQNTYKDPISGIETTPDMMMAHVQDCLSKTNNFIKGPDGTSLKIKVMGPAEWEKMDPARRPTLAAMQIMEPSRRSPTGGTFNTSTEFNTDIKCGTVTHELLHHLGLDDEYDTSGFHGAIDPTAKFCPFPKISPSSTMGAASGASGYPSLIKCKCDSVCQQTMAGDDEEWKKFYASESSLDIDFKLQSSCKTTQRVVNFASLSDKGKTQILANEENNFKMILRYVGNPLSKDVVEKTVECQCAGDDENCKILLPKEQNAFAKKFKESWSCVGKGLDYQDEVSATSIPEAYRLEEGILTYTSPATLPSIILPAHFAKITNPGCRSATPKYDICSKWRAAVNGIETKDTDLVEQNASGRGQCAGSLGDNTCAVVSCDNRPKYCEDGTYTDL